MFKSRNPKQLPKDSSLEEVIEFMNELSVEIHNTSLRQSGIDPYEEPRPYDLNRIHKKLNRKL